jgi:hypothetical protein
MPISLSGSLNLSGSLTTTGTITATTLVVQTITSSISSITGSTNFGSLSSNTHVFTGSMYVTGAFYVTTGSVGIGTISPTFNINPTSKGLDVTNISNFSSLTFHGTGSQEASIAGGGNAAGLYIDVAGDTAATNNSIFFRTSNTNSNYGVTTKMAINSNGNVGIGIIPVDKFQVNVATNKNIALRLGANSLPSVSFVNDTVGAYVAGEVDFSSSLALMGGNVGIGTITPGYTLEVNANAATWATRIYNASATGNGLVVVTQNTTTAAGLALYNGSSYVLYARNDGQVGIGTSSPTYTLHVMGSVYSRYDANTNAAISAVNQSSAGSRCYYGQKYNNSVDDYYMVFDNNVANKFLFYGNGGLGNVQANNANISDRRTKKDIISLESYWNKFKAIEIVKFKYIDQDHDDYNIGLIAQQLEEIAPEFIDSDGWGKNTPMETEEPLKTVYTTDLYHATIKVLQEAMAKIETLEARVQYLENK